MMRQAFKTTKFQPIWMIKMFCSLKFSRESEFGIFNYLDLIVSIGSNWSTHFRYEFLIIGYATIFLNMIEKYF